MKVIYIAVQLDAHTEERLRQVLEEARNGTTNALASNPHEMWDFDVFNTTAKFPALAHLLALHDDEDTVNHERDDD